MSADKGKAPPSLHLEYDLLELPTAQHKAGLAGLILHLRSLAERKITDGPVLERLTPLEATIRVDERALQVLLDDLYCARVEQVKSASKYSGKPPLDEVMVEVTRGGKVTREKRFIYEEVRPCGLVLERWLAKGREDPWLGLWKSMLWAVLRAQPKTRGDYQARAAGQSVGLAPKLWKSLQKAHVLRAKGQFVTESISGSLFVGAQDKNAEQVSFVGRVEHNLLLHFWQWATPIFVPRTIDPHKGTSSYQGYLLAVPEVADLVEFTDEMERYWKGLDPATTGIRPAGALVDLAEEGGLEFLYHLTRHEIEKTDLRYALHGVELYHQEKRGNNVRQVAAERMRPSRHLLDEYARMRDDRRQNPLFKRLRIGNLVHARGWYDGAQDLFAHYPAEHFIHGPKTPPGRFFGTDVRRLFESTIKNLEDLEQAMEHTERDEQLQRLIYKLIRSYVETRTRDRASLDKDTRFEAMSPAEKQRYSEAKPKVASNAFLSLRGRRDQDITDYFAGTLSAFGRHLSEDEFVLLGDALLRTPEKVKNLTLLALSAHSWTARDPGAPKDASQSVPE